MLVSLFLIAWINKNLTNAALELITLAVPLVTFCCSRVVQELSSESQKLQHMSMIITFWYTLYWPIYFEGCTCSEHLRIRKLILAMQIICICINKLLHAPVARQQAVDRSFQGRSLSTDMKQQHITLATCSPAVEQAVAGQTLFRRNKAVFLDWLNPKAYIETLAVAIIRLSKQHITAERELQSSRN
jgi:hypothetical protein